MGWVALVLVSTQAHAVGSIAQVVVIDRKTGVELVPHYHHGEYWVAGTPGANYAIDIRNRLGERLLAVASVDGVNVISGETAGWDQTGYVFDPGQSYQITGWRKSDEEVAAFTFTDSPNSYAERTGRPANVGVIGIALFRERQKPQVYSPPPVPAPEPLRDQSARAESSNQRAPLASAPKLGTGHGEREASFVSHTAFERMQSDPNEVIRIRYDSYDNLVAMGVIPRPLHGVAVANPFPASAQQQYVPDPP
jgi:hypothetical protein